MHSLISTPMTFTTYQIADVSTVHITANDGALLSESDFTAQLAKIHPFEESPGSILYVEFDPEIFADDVTEWRKEGFSEAFIAIMTELHRQRIPYVRFDVDSESVDGAATFEW